MVLKINVTWPEPLPQVCIPMDCRGTMEPVSNKATTDGVHITVDGAFGLGNRVCDEDRYRFGRESEGPLECCESGTHFDQTLVLLLESPHEKEYANGCIDRPLVPALGTTGRNIRDYLIPIIRNCNHLYNLLEPEVMVRVIIANPIQFQCSLKSVIQYRNAHDKQEWKQVRNVVWKALWNREAIQRDFRERLINYHPDFIINACTHDKGCGGRCLNGRSFGCRKRRVRLLLENFCSAKKYEANHPVTWGSQDRRRLVPVPSH